MTRRRKTACASRPSAMLALLHDSSLPASTTSACTATRNQPSVVQSRPVMGAYFMVGVNSNPERAGAQGRRRQKSEVRSRKVVYTRSELKAGGWKLEAGGERTEGGTREVDAGVKIRGEVRGGLVGPIPPGPLTPLRSASGIYDLKGRGRRADGAQMRPHLPPSPNRRGAMLLSRRLAAELALH